MKRSVLFVCSVSLLVALAAAGTAEQPGTETADLTLAPVEPFIGQNLGISAEEAEGLACEVIPAAGLGSTLCLCICEGPIWSIEDVRTTGSCSELVGQSCWSFGPGTYTSCFADGPGFP